MVKSLLAAFLILLGCAAATTPSQPATQAARAPASPPAASAEGRDRTPVATDEMIIASANKRVATVLGELERDSSVAHLRLLAEIDRAHRNAVARQEQARLDLAAKTALAESRLARGSQDKGPDLRKAYSTEVAQAAQAFTQRLAEINGEQAQAIAQAVQRFGQEKAELVTTYEKGVQAAAQRLTQDLAAADLPRSVAGFKATLPPFAQSAPTADAESEAAYRADVDAARKAYADAMSQARSKVLANLQRSLDAASSSRGPGDDQLEAIDNTIKRLGMLAADSLDTYQIAIKSALRKVQLREQGPEADATSR